MDYWSGQAQNPNCHQTNASSPHKWQQVTAHSTVRAWTKSLCYQLRLVIQSSHGNYQFFSFHPILLSAKASTDVAASTSMTCSNEWSKCCLAYDILTCCEHMIKITPENTYSALIRFFPFSGLQSGGLPCSTVVQQVVLQRKQSTAKIVELSDYSAWFQFFPVFIKSPRDIHM